MLSTKQAVTRYITAFIIFVAGIIGFVAFLLFSISDLTDMKQYVVPGVHTLELEESGKYTIFHEHKSMIDGEYLYSDGVPAGLKMVVTSQEGDTICVKPLSSGGSYSVGSREGTGVGSFKIDSPGSYTLNGTFTGGNSSKTVLTVTGGFGSGLVITVLCSMLILFGSMTFSFVLAIVTLVKQLTGKKRTACSL